MENRHLPFVRGPEWLHLFLTTVPNLGINIVWSTEMAFASPYLISLGLSKSMIAWVFFSGPISGLLIQPIVGHIADRSTNAYGRRRPTLVIGCLASIASLLLLGFTRHVSNLFSSGTIGKGDLLTGSLAVFAVFAVNFSLNAAMTVARALLYDIFPQEKQAVANAWAGRMGGLGAVIGFFIGQADLPRYFPSFGDTQMEVLAVLASGVLSATILLTIYAVQERPLDRDIARLSESVWSPLKSLTGMPAAFSQLPQTIKLVCWIQFCTWLGWFPYNFFSTTWIGEHYRLEHPMQGSPTVGDNEAATRAGAQALLWASIVALITLVVGPYLISDEDRAMKSPRLNPTRGRSSTFDRLLSFRPTLITVYAGAHLVVGVMLLFTFISTSVRTITIIVTVLGIPHGIINWAPYSLVGEAVNSTSVGGNVLYAPLDAEEGPPSDTTIPDQSSIDVTESNVKDQAGTIVGIHNTSIVIPQFIMIATSSVIFSIFDPKRTVISPAQDSDAISPRDGDTQGSKHVDALAIVFRLGGLAAFGSFFLTLRLRRYLMTSKR